MPRVKRGKSATKKREKLLKYTKGYKWSRKSKERAAREALLHAWTHSYRGRKEEKRVNRAEWNVRINAAARMHGLTYHKLIHALKEKNIALDRKILANLAEEHPDVFAKIVSLTQS